MNMIKVGPVGKFGRHIWEEKGRDQIAGIFISYAEGIVLSLQFMFYENGDLIMSEKYGRSYDQRGDYCAVILDYPSEFLTSISGSFEQMNKKRTKVQIGNYRLFGGFFGSQYEDSIESIGFYVKAIPSSIINLKDSTVNVKKEKDDDDY